jgi:DNA-binding SARP family transcriptional activator
VLEFRILGPLEVWYRERRFTLAGQKRRALLAFLLLNANRVVASDHLIDALWGEDPPETGAKALQMQVTELRKALAVASDSVVVTRPPGYLVDVEPGALDLERFETLAEEGRLALARGTPAEAAERLREALALWRGPPLAEFSFAPFARAAAGRLEELRLAALEKRIEADLALGRHGDIVAELEELITDHPFRERLRGQLMLALYRAGRQADALSLYQETRRELADELGIEPGHALRDLHKAILRHEPTLDLAAPEAQAEVRRIWESPATERSILVVPTRLPALNALVEIAEPLTRRPRREIVLAALVAHDRELDESAAILDDLRRFLTGRGVSARSATFTTEAWADDVVRLASEQDVDLVVVDAPASVLTEGVLTEELDAVLREAPCDVAVFVARDGPEAAEGERPIIVPFGGHEHEWAAVEIGAWIASATQATLRLLGSTADPAVGKRDASRLLAGVSLVVQRASGIATAPLLVPPGEAGVLKAAAEARLLIIGLSDRWPKEGLGSVRLALARSARPPVLLVRRGLRPGGLAPPAELTRYTWSLAHQREEA